jgi:hypothetical protein
MLFKNDQRFGIWNCLLVEVDLGSARMEDFHVVGLPDKALKQSRQ